MNSKRHPLFRPQSKYGQLRSAFAVEEKIRGYFYWLAARASRQQSEAEATRPAHEGEIVSADPRGLPLTCRSLIFLVRAESLSPVATVQSPGPPTCIAWCGEQLVWGTASGEVAMVDPQQPHAPQSLYRHEGAVLSLAVGADGMIVSGAADGTVAFWNAHTSEMSAMNEHAAPVVAVTVLADGRCLSVSSDGRSKLWDPRTGWVLTTEVSSADDVESLSGREMKVVTRSEPVPVAVPGSGQTLLTMAQQRIEMQWLPAEGPHQRSRASAAPMLLWNASSRQGRMRQFAEALAAAMLPDGRIVVGGADQQLTICHAETHEAEHSYRFEAPVVTVAVSISGCIACGTADGRIHLLRVAGIEALDVQSAQVALHLLPQALRFRAENLPPGANCRLLVLDPKMLSHLRESVPRLMSAADDAQLLARVLDARTLEHDIKAARILSAVPDADGKVSDDGRLEITAGIPEESPPLPSDSFVVLAVEQPEAHSAGEQRAESKGATKSG